MLLDQIIELLGNDEASVVEALLKTKVLMHDIGVKEPVAWLNHELNGYPPDADLPEYRVLGAQVVANVATIAWRMSSHPIPIGHLKEKEQRLLQRLEMRDSIAVVQDLTSGDSNGHIARPIPMENNSLLAKGLADGLHVERAWCETPRSQVRNVVVQVRSRLLDFLLELRGELGPTPPPDELRDRAKKIDTVGLFTNAIFGANTTIVVGEQKTTNVRLTVPVGDTEELIRRMKEIGLPASDLEDLRSAIKLDVESAGTASLEGNTGRWLSRTIGRAAKGALGVGIDVVSSTAAKLLAAYLGMPTN